MQKGINTCSSVGNYVQIIGVVLLYWTISISLVFANKYLVGNTANNLQDISLLVAWLQCVLTVLLIFGSRFVRALITQDWRVLAFPLHLLRSRPLLLMTLSFVAMLSFNNLCLHNVHVSFYQVARSLTLIFTVVLSVLVLRRPVSLRVMACCTLVVNGFILGVDQESLMGTLSSSGLLYGISSSLFVALNGIFTKQALEVTQGDAVQLTLLSNINAVLLFVPVLLATNQFRHFAENDNISYNFCLFLIGTGVLGFFIAWISALQIHLTSPVSHHISSNTKAVLQTILAVVYFGESRSPLWWLSVGMVVMGATAYALVRLWEERQDAKKHLSGSLSKIQSDPSC
ncbi:hypothetical protein CAPTEDRAFT_187616 [Capitella teleta]|uniref:Sugar phosphate transporter domain-containing protein n=1 Tax=Capitella teleta TaxID=283909 RepID=R7ULK5_CAPTE|nr:hypothetical protein CAPTEDRAFT_187616 [Capitella teleta]|eukprot:ELU04157.1 hypothetical protein CAPTEDRAFT_187616 [Capitella teleta]